MTKIALPNGQYADQIVAAQTGVGGTYKLPDGTYAQTVVPVDANGNVIVDSGGGGTSSPATSTAYGTVKTNTTSSTPVVYLSSEVDTLNASNVNLAGAQTINGAKTFSSIVNVTNTTTASSTTTGSLITAGGIGVATNGYFGGNIYYSGSAFGTSTTKVNLISSDDGTVTTTSLFSSNQGLVILGQGATEQTVQLKRASGEYLNLLAARGGASGLNNAYFIDCVSGSVGAMRPFFFRIRETATSTVYNSLSLFNTGRVGVGSNTDDGVNALQVNGSIKGSQFKLSALNTAPTSATDTGVLGDIRIDASYIYVCVATNTWKRTGLSTW
ncbi:MAG: hypothetical protein V7K21_11580 [Nostoc sp.]|uniref:hypothetical protein n=1 Tax=Nostoc sp. TaxID=1180 RepID=UPI002FF6AF77